MTNENQSCDDLETLRLPELKQRFLDVLGEETRCPNKQFLIRRIRQALRDRAQQAAMNDSGVDAAQPAGIETTTEGAADDSAAEVADDQDENTEEAEHVEDERPDESEDELEHALVDELAADDPGADDPAAEDQEPRATPEQPAAPRLHPLRRRPREAQRSERGRFKSMTVEELQTLYLQTVGRPTGSSDKSYLIWKIREAEKGRIPIGPRESRTSNQQGSTDVRILPLRLDADAVEQLDAAWKAHGMKSRMEFFRRALGHYLEHIGANEAAALFAASDR